VEHVDIIHRKKKTGVAVEGTHQQCLDFRLCMSNMIGVETIRWEPTRIRWVSQINYKLFVAVVGQCRFVSGAKRGHAGRTKVGYLPTAQRVIKRRNNELR